MGGDIFILTGDPNSGKTTALAAWVESYRQEGLKIGGTLAPAQWQGHQKIAYDIVDVATGQRHIMASLRPLEDAEYWGRFWFSREGIRLGEEALMRLNTDWDVGIVDEAGPLELAGGGLGRGLRHVLAHPPQNLIIVIRTSLIKPVTQAFGISHYQSRSRTSQKP